MITICINNHKGGVAKSTTVQACATILNELGHPTLVIDTDEQCNTTDSFQAKTAKQGGLTFFDLIENRRNEYTIDDVIQHTDFGDIIASDKNSADKLNNIIVSSEKDGTGDGNLLLKKYLTILAKENKYEYVLIDTNMNSDNLLNMCLAASDEVIIPLDEDFYSIQGCLQLYPLITKIAEDYKTSLSIAGLLLTRVHPRYTAFKAQRESAETIAVNTLHTRVFDTYIPECTLVPHAHFDATNVVHAYPDSSATKAYRSFVTELLKYESSKQKGE